MKVLKVGDMLLTNDIRASGGQLAEVMGVYDKTVQLRFSSLDNANSVTITIPLYKAREYEVIPPDALETFYTLRSIANER